LLEALVSEVNQLALEVLKALGEALFEFAEVSDLEAWFSAEMICFWAFGVPR
jgi:hypothetical protein